MANRTPNLSLILPNLGEFTDRWNEPLNGNFELVDDAIGKLEDEVVEARGNATSLNARISAAIDADGNVIAIPELVSARNSTVYGAEADGSDFSLDRRIELGDLEAFDGRNGLGSLRDSLAFNNSGLGADCIVSAPANFITFTGANVKVDGATLPVVANINGYRQVVRKQKQVTISGGAADYFIYLDRSPAGELVLDRTGVNMGTGAVSVDDAGKYTKFSDSTQNFAALGVSAGDLLTITTPSSPNAHTYVVNEVLSATELTINGRFETPQAALLYKIQYPLGPSLGFTAEAHSATFVPVANRIYIARATFDGTNVTSVTQYALNGKYEEFFAATANPDYLLSAIHRLGYFPKSVEVYASASAGYTSSLVPMGFGVAEGAGVTSNSRNVVVDMNQSLIRVKNASAGIVYKDFAGAAQASAYILVRAKR